MLRFIPHIKDFSVFRGFSMGFQNILSLLLCPLVLLQALTFSPKSCAPLVKHWRSQALHNVVYLDDGLGVCGTK